MTSCCALHVLCAVCCVLCAVCCLLCAVCCVLFAVCCVLCVVGCLLFAVCREMQLCTVYLEQFHPHSCPSVEEREVNEEEASHEGEDHQERVQYAGHSRDN